MPYQKYWDLPAHNYHNMWGWFSIIQLLYVKCATQSYFGFYRTRVVFVSKSCKNVVGKKNIQTIFVAHQFAVLIWKLMTNYGNLQTKTASFTAAINSDKQFVTIKTRLASFAYYITPLEGEQCQGKSSHWSIIPCPNHKKSPWPQIINSLFKMKNTPFSFNRISSLFSYYLLCLFVLFHLFTLSLPYFLFWFQIISFCYHKIKFILVYNLLTIQMVQLMFLTALCSFCGFRIHFLIPVFLLVPFIICCTCMFKCI